MLKEKKIKLCFIGNPNVGKSTLINRLLNSNELEISKNPGTTETIIEKNLIRNEKEFILLDTAGVYKKKNFNFNLLIKATRFSEIVVLILDSSIDKLDKIHKKLVSHTLKVGKGLIIIFNKWDLIKNKKNKKKELEKFVKLTEQGRYPSSISTPLSPDELKVCEVIEKRGAIILKEMGWIGCGGSPPLLSSESCIDPNWKKAIG